MPDSPRVFIMSLLATLNLVTKVCLGISAKVSVGELIPAQLRGPCIAASKQVLEDRVTGRCPFHHSQ